MSGIIGSAKLKSGIIGQLESLNVAGNAAAGITILAPDANDNSLCFGSPSDSVGAKITWNHDADLLTIATANPAADMVFATGDNVARMKLLDSGYFGIGTMEPAYRLEVKGATGAYMAHISNEATGGGEGFCLSMDMLHQDDQGDIFLLCTSERDENNNPIPRHKLGGNGDYLHTGSSMSDRNLKENIENCDHGLDEILALTPRIFNWKGDGDSTNLRHGFIAQEAEIVAPNMVRTSSKNGEKSFDYQGMSAVLTKAVQELSAKVTALESA